MQLCQDISPKVSYKSNNETKSTSYDIEKDDVSVFNQYLGKNKQKLQNSQDYNLEANKKSVKIFVGGVPPKLSEGYLRHLFKAEFSKIPEVKNKFKILNACCFKGFGFINITGLSKSQVEEALRDFNLVYNYRRFITRVAIDSNLSNETKLKKRDCKVLVKNLSDDITHVELNEYFSQFGKLDNTYAAFDTETGKHKNFGFVIFENFEDVKKVLDIKKHVIKGTTVNAVENYLKEEWDMMKEKGLSSKIARKRRKSKCSSNSSKNLDSSKSEIVDSSPKHSGQNEGTPKNSNESEGTPKYSNQSESGPIKESKFDLKTQGGHEIQSPDTMQLKVNTKKQIKKPSLPQKQIICPLNDQNEKTMNSEHYNYYAVSSNKFTPNANYETQSNYYNNKGYADPNTAVYNGYDYQNQGYLDRPSQQYPQKSYYEFYNQNAPYDQYQTNYPCPQLEKNYPSNYDYNYNYDNYGQPQSYSNYNTESGYETNNYGLNNQVYSVQNSELQNEQPQVFQNYQTNDYYRQDNMAYNSNSLNEPVCYQSNTNQNLQPYQYYEPSDQTYQNNTKDSFKSAAYDKNRK